MGFRWLRPRGAHTMRALTRYGHAPAAGMDAALPGTVLMKLLRREKEFSPCPRKPNLGADLLRDRDPADVSLSSSQRRSRRPRLRPRLRTRMRTALIRASAISTGTTRSTPTT